MTKRVGIALGNYSSCCGVLLHKKVDIIINDMGNRTTSCCIAFGNSSECFIGDLARKQANHDNPNFVFNIKKMLGKKYSEISFDRPFTIVRKKGDKIGR